MLQMFLNIFRERSQHRKNTAIAIINALSDLNIKSSVRIKHVQMIDDYDNIHLYTDDGKEYIPTLTLY